MNRRGFLKLLGLGAGAAAVAATLPDILTPDDDAWEPARRYWQGWSPQRWDGPVTTQAQIDKTIATYVAELRTVMEHEAVMAALVDVQPLPRGVPITYEFPEIASSTPPMKHWKVEWTPSGSYDVLVPFRDCGHRL